MGFVEKRYGGYRIDEGILGEDPYRSLQDKNVLAMKYQIYDACEGAIKALVAQASRLTETELDAELETLTAVAVRRVAERAQDYSYEYRSETFVRGVVLSLFDSCFLAFDGTS